MLKLFTLLFLLTTIFSLSKSQTVNYVNHVPYDLPGCLGQVVGHGTSYLLNACIPMENYSIKHVLNGTNVVQFFYGSSRSCSGPSDSVSTDIGGCYSYKLNGIPANPFFYAKASVSEEPINPPSQTHSIYFRAYSRNDQVCNRRFTWSKYVTGGTTWLVTPTIRETVFCNNGIPTEQYCNITNGNCWTRERESDCEPFPQQLSYTISKCVYIQPNNFPQVKKLESSSSFKSSTSDYKIENEFDDQTFNLSPFLYSTLKKV
eukprot:gene2177-2680_t